MDVPILRKKFHENKLGQDMTTYTYAECVYVVLCNVSGQVYYKERVIEGTYYTDFKPLPDGYAFEEVTCAKDAQVSAEVIRRMDRYTLRCKVVGKTGESFSASNFENVMCLMGFPFSCDSNGVFYFDKIKVITSTNGITTNRGDVFPYTLAGLSGLVRVLLE